MDESKLTPWFPPTVTPVREGVYLRSLSDGRFPLYSYWNGRFWGLLCTNKYAAETHKDLKTLCADEKWRGLTREVRDAL